MEERERFIRDWQLDLYTMTELSARYDVSRKTGYKWLDRFDEGGRQALGDRSRAPHQCPHRISERTAHLICDARRQHPTWGPDKLLDWLEPRHPLETLLQPQPRTVEQRHHQPRRARETLHHLAHFVAAEHDRHPLRRPSPRHVLDCTHVHVQDVAVEKQQCTQRLILRRRADVLAHGQPRQERRNFVRAHRRRMSQFVKDDEPPNPMDVRFFSPSAVMTRANRFAHAIEQLG